MIQPTPPSPTNGQVGEQQASRLQADGVDAASSRGNDSRSWSGANMSNWLKLFPAIELDQSLAKAAALWRETTRRDCLILWSSDQSGERFAFAGTSSGRPRADWMHRLVTFDEASTVVGTLVHPPGIAAWLDWLGIRCHERNLLNAPLALDDTPALGQICFFPSGRSVPAVDSIGLEVTTRALWQATLFESQLQQRKLAALGELAAGAGHEVNNPLGTILGRSQQLLREERHPERRRWLATIGAQALRVRDMISDLMLFARPLPPKLQEVDLAAVIRAVQTKFTADRNDVGFELDLQEGLIIAADATQTEIVVSELLRNSLFAANEDGVIRITAERTTSAVNPRKNVIRLTWSDNGPGLNELEREHLFDPFFSGRQAGRGLGFGLSKCWQILRNHGGTIRVANPGSEEMGLTLVLEWPVSVSANSAPLRDI